MKFRNELGETVEFSEEELNKLIKDMVVSNILNIPQNAKEFDYFLVDE